MIIALSVILVLVCIFIGMGIPFSFLAGSVFWAMLDGSSMGSFVSTSYYSLDAYSLLALPLFMAAGILLERSGIWWIWPNFFCADSKAVWLPPFPLSLPFLERSAVPAWPA